MNYVFVATGTGIAPFRAMLRELHAMGGIPKHCQVWLLFGVRTAEDIIYDAEFRALASQYPSFHYQLALSREMKNTDGSKKYVQHLLTDHSVELFKLLNQINTHTYLCGLKGMEKGVAVALSDLATQGGLDPQAFISAVTDKARYYEEVY